MFINIAASDVSLIPLELKLTKFSSAKSTAREGGAASAIRKTSSLPMGCFVWEPNRRSKPSLKRLSQEKRAAMQGLSPCRF
jgi:hypothetical protein